MSFYSWYYYKLLKKVCQMLDHDDFVSGPWLYHCDVMAYACEIILKVSRKPHASLLLWFNKFGKEIIYKKIDN